MYTDDNDGHVLPGYRYGYAATDRTGRDLQHPINARYPWRLAPYLDKNFEVLYVNRNRALLHSFARDDEARYAYAASLFPSLAANAVFVGGDDSVLSPSELSFDQFGPFCVVKESQAKRPSELIVFVSGRHIFNERPVDGFYRTTPPYLAQRNWPEAWDPDIPPAEFGFVHPRYSGRAVAALMDGHAEGFSFEELQDMRRWANTADRHDWTLRADCPPPQRSPPPFGTQARQ